MKLQEIEEEKMPIQVRPKTIKRSQRNMISAKETTMKAEVNMNKPIPILTKNVPNGIQFMGEPQAMPAYPKAKR